MKKSYIIITTIIGLGILGAILILITTPKVQTTSGSGAPTPVPDRGDTLHGASIDGQLVLSRQGSLWLWKGDNAHRLGLDPGSSIVANNQVQLIQPALSADGSKLAYVRQDETFSDLWVAASDGTNAHSLTSDRGNGTPRSPNFLGSSLWAFSPTWSPDGTEIAFLSDVGTDDLTLRVTNATKFTSKAINNRLAVTQGGLQRPSWSPDGNNLAVAAFENGKSQIYSIKASNGLSTKLTDQPDGAYDPAWSPDGNSIAFVNRRANSNELWLMHSDGSSPTMLTSQNSRQPVWSPDGKKIAFLSLKDGAFEIFWLDLNADITGASGSPHQLSQNARLDGASGFTWSR